MSVTPRQFFQSGSSPIPITSLSHHIRPILFLSAITLVYYPKSPFLLPAFFTAFSSSCPALSPLFFFLLLLLLRLPPVNGTASRLSATRRRLIYLVSGPSHLSLFLHTSFTFIDPFSALCSKVSIQMCHEFALRRPSFTTGAPARAVTTTKTYAHTGQLANKGQILLHP